MPKLESEQIKEIENIIIREIRQYNSGGAFVGRKVTDTPTDSLSLVSRRYVTLNGDVADRPKSSVATVGQHYLATDTNIPMIYTVGGWRNGSGSIVAQNN